MFVLIPFMIEKISIILIVAFLLSQLRSFRQIVRTKQTRKDKLIMILLFGTFGIISNYTGIEVFGGNPDQTGWYSVLDDNDAIANTRVLGVVIGGLIGGPVIGTGAGIISAVHRYFLGGFTAFACSVSTVIAGMLSGFLGKKKKEKGEKITVKFAVVNGVAMEALQMLIILLTAKPFDRALELVKLISFPMIVVNGLGTMVFMLIIELIKHEDNRLRAVQTEKALSIAQRTLPYFREGLNTESCAEISKIILHATNADAVAITNKHTVLSHVGIGSDHHQPLFKPETKLTNRVLQSGKIEVARDKDEIGCQKDNCPLEAAIVIPLNVKNHIAGTLKMYYKDPDKLDEVQEHLAYGLGSLFATQLELVEAEKQAKLLKDAKIKALQAQIHPHFLFNSLNTISALCRIHPEKARELLVKLSSFLRGNMQGARQLFLPLEKELELVKAYIAIVQARFPEKYEFHFHIDSGLKKCSIPPLIVQPLVENAVNHGFSGSKQKGEISIRIFSKNDHLNIVVTDNGKWIPQDRLRLLGKQTVASKKGHGTAILNIVERLNGLYGGKAKMKIDSIIEKGTTCTISIPLNQEGGW